MNDSATLVVPVRVQLYTSHDSQVNLNTQYPMFGYYVLTTIVIAVARPVSVFSTDNNRSPRREQGATEGQLHKRGVEAGDVGGLPW